MAKADIARLFALGAAFFIAIGDVIHQRSAHEVTDEPVSHLELFKRLLRDGQWWLGSLVAAVGFALQAVALGLGSVLLVQALLVTSLLFALPINARASHRRVTRWEWMWAALLAAAVVVIVTVGNPTAGHSRASLDTWTAVVVVLGPALVACVLGANVLKGPASAGAARGGVRCPVGPVRRADQGRGGPARRRPVGTGPHSRAVRVGAGRHRGHGLPAGPVP
jgi:drug/metabolite transporter (DMT)-like permease